MTPTALHAGAPDSPRRSADQVRSIDGLRAIAVLAVMGTHLDLQFAGGGVLGVDVFFVLSGFLITSLLLNEYSKSGEIWWRGFFARRALRLLPALWVVSAATLVMSALSRDALPPEVLRRNGVAVPDDLFVNTWKEVGSALLYVANFPTWLGAKDVFFGHAWSLSIEEQFYVLLPLLWWAVARIDRPSRRGTVVLGLALILGVARVVGVVGPFGLIGYRVDALFLGVGVALTAADEHVSRRVRTTASSVAPVALGIVVAIVVATAPDLGKVSGQALALAIAGASAVLVTALWHGSGGPVSQFLALTPLVLVGRISYGLYLWHLPIIRRVGLMELSWPSPAIVALKVAVTFVASALCFVFVERPLLRLKDRFRR